MGGFILKIEMVLSGVEKKPFLHLNYIVEHHLVG